MPSVTDAAINIQKFGAHGITVHPRPDERHITRKDVYDLRPLVTTEFNIEGYPSEDFMAMVLEVQPEQVTLVPDPPDVLTSNAGWKIAAHQEQLKIVAQKLKGLRIAVFVEPDTCSLEELKFLKEIGIARIEMYTEGFAKAFESGDSSLLQSTMERYQKLYQDGLSADLEINAGHDLSQANLGYFLKHLPEVSEVSIGHALIGEALYEGLPTTIGNYLKILAK